MAKKFIDWIWYGLPYGSQRHKLSIALLILGLSCTTPLTLVAQDSGSATTPNSVPAAQSGQDTSTFGELVAHSGPVVWICVLLSILVMTFTIEGFLKLRFEALCPPAQLNHLKGLMAEYRYQEAWEYCAGQSSFLCTVVKAGLERIGRGVTATEYTLQEVVSQQSILLKMNSHYLSAIGVVAPMIGLSGTVIGMIKAFKQLGSSINGDPAGLAAAIGEVLTATAAGLLVAIPAFVFYYVLKARAQTAIMLADSAVYHLFEDVPFDRIIGLRFGATSSQPLESVEMEPLQEHGSPSIPHE